MDHENSKAINPIRVMAEVDVWQRIKLQVSCINSFVNDKH